MKLFEQFLSMIAFFYNLYNHHYKHPHDFISNLIIITIVFININIIIIITTFIKITTTTIIIIKITKDLFLPSVSADCICFHRACSCISS